jgi:hypothetical protein
MNDWEDERKIIERNDPSPFVPVHFLFFVPCKYFSEFNLCKLGLNYPAI